MLWFLICFNLIVRKKLIVELAQKLVGMKLRLMKGIELIKAEATQQPKKLLLVEDNRVNRLVSERLLSMWGYEVHTAADGLTALKLVGVNAYDLILMNLGLPGLSGRQTTSLIRKLSLHYQHVPILAITANRMQLNDSLEPFTDLLEVPYMPEQLKNLLHQYLAEAVPLSSLEQLQVRIDEISGNDPLFRKQLLGLFVQNCRDLLTDLQLGRLDSAEYLSRVRHKHRSSLRLLELFSLEAALDNLQEALEHRQGDTGILLQRKNALAQHAGAVMDELNDLAA